MQTLNNAKQTRFDPDYALQFLDLDSSCDKRVFDRVIMWSTAEEASFYWKELHEKYCYDSNEEERQELRRDPNIRQKLIYYLSLAGIPWSETPIPPPIPPGSGLWNRVAFEKVADYAVK